MAPSIPETMLAVVLEEYQGECQIKRVPVPRPGPGQVLVRMAAAPINPSDLLFLQGTYLVRKELPAIPGLEGSGVVVAHGSGLVPRILQGRRVAVSATATLGGTWAEYMVTGAFSCIPLSRKLTLEQGATALVNPLSAMALVTIAREGKHRALVNTAAAGSLGRMLVRLCQDYQMPAIHIVHRPAQVSLLRAMGATHVLDSSAADFTERLHTSVRELNASLFLDAVAGEMTSQLLAAAPTTSTIVVYGRLSGRPTIVDLRDLIHRDLHLQGFYLATWLRQRGLLRTLWMARKAHQLLDTTLASPVAQRVPLREAASAVKFYNQDMTAGKVLLVANEMAVPLHERHNP